ncbi:MAG: 2-C-methyl-D-erythritol 2,4-cyclodiphosphate synthase [Bacilli bacterium]|jgi:2-C-methyl-D-erythritol 2,4-cyclodiphosphate synthase|nr:2-C-methyl-D-erythritol 2,4-cyclodiphosphate synthase [Bacilli bacterium]MDD4005639.1 2-C-methyl-D-erythritol 2,4-cyclodiphosphate synthase [Bacilli bacterium]
MYRIGYGEDIHRLVEGRKLILGGVDIPYHKGLLGHSDADVVCHALCDAMLGALALGDIGSHFPDTDEKFRGANSVDLLKKVNGLIHNAGYEVNNVDISIALEKPRLSAYVMAMRSNISSAIEAPISSISLKAMTNEGLDSVGRGEACRAIAVVLLKRI